jgi:hypothetical protein
MAEYYPLLAKAVASLPDSTPVTRHAVYERARKALLGQLRALQPPVPEDDIDRENQALDEAVARLEAEFNAAAQGSATQEAPIDSPPAEPPPAATASKARPLPPPRQAAEPRPASNGPAPNMIRPKIAKVAPAPAPAGSPEPKSDAAEVPQERPIVTANTSSFPKAASENPIAGTVKTRPETQRPSAPRAPGARSNAKGLWIVFAVIGLIIVGVAATAWKLRDKPEDLAKLKTIQAPQSETGGKIGGRVGENTRPKDVAPAAGASTSQAASDTTTNVPVTYRAALLVEAPEEANKVKTYFGTVIWRLDNVSNGPGEPLGTAVHANVDIPEDKLQVSMTMQKNVDASLPASHTMTIVFLVQPSTPTGAIKLIGLPQMRKEDSSNGEALAGLPVPIMENSFLIGLAKGAPEINNLDLLKTRQWIDIPIGLANGHRAKLTFEKGVAGQRAVDDAIASWQTQ